MNAALIGLFELTQDMVQRDGSDPAAPDVPYTDAAKLVWLDHAANRYGHVDMSPATRLYHPTAFRNGAGLPLGTPSFSAGTRVYAWYNTHSGRWEILQPALDLLRIELTGVLLPHDDHVTATLADDPAEPEITVYRAGMAFNVGIGRPGGGDHAGTLAFALWSPSRRRWEILGGQFKLTAEAVADEPIATGGVGTVSLWWTDYATNTLVDSGRDVLALNWLHPPVAAGKKVLVRYDRQENRWTIVAAE